MRHKTKKLKSVKTPARTKKPFADYFFAAHYLRIVDPNESLESNWRDDLKDLKGLITYKRKCNSWYVISGVTTNGYVFYYKFFTQNNNWATFHIIYPKSQKPKYDPWVTRIEKHFVPFLKGNNYERAVWKGQQNNLHPPLPALPLAK